MSSTNVVTPSGFDTVSFGNVVELSSPNAVTIKIVEKGLHVAAITFKDKNGFEHDIVVGSDDPKHYVDERKFRHCLVGRYCNRLPSEQALPIDDTSITLPSYPSPGQTLHGGPSPAGWDEHILKPVSDPTLFSSEEKSVLKAAKAKGGAEVWGLTSPDGEGGHVGTVEAEVAFLSLPPKDDTANEVGRIVVIYRARVIDAPATALNLTQHWAFNLAASGLSKGQPKDAEEVGIYDHNLSLLTKNILNLDPVTSLPTGTLLPLSTPSAASKNFGQPGGKTIGHKGKGYPTALKGETKEEKMGQGFPNEGYDDFWVFDREAKGGLVIGQEGLEGLNVFAEMDADSQTVATLSAPQTSLSISFKTNQPGMQAWSGVGGFDGSDARKVGHGGDSTRGTGKGYNGAANLAMEFHAIYCAWMHPELKPLGWDTILRKGEVYNNWVELSVRSD